MTIIQHKQEGNRYSIQCSGHTTGSEKVCASVSGLIYALAGYLINTEEITTETMLLESGKALFVFVGETEAKSVYEMTVVGLLQLEKTFPSFIKVGDL